LAEYVDEAEFVEHLGQPRAFLRQETGILLVAAPVAKVDRLVRDVPVAAQHDLAPGLAQRAQVRQEGSEKPEFRCLAMGAAGARWQIDADYRQCVEVRLEVAAFDVELR